MNTQVIGYGLTLLTASGGIAHEYLWRRHLSRSEILAGKIVGQTRGRNGMLPVIAYAIDGKEQEFTSNYGGGKIEVGQEVTVAFNRASGRAEVITTTSRWAWTLIPLGLAAFMFVCLLFRIR